MDYINLPILIFAVLLCISTLTSLISSRIGIPLILLFLCIGLLFGASDMQVLESLRHAKSAFFIGSVALALILFDSGYQTQMRSYKQVSRASVLLATIGVVATTAILAPFAYFILNIGWLPAFLLSAVVGSTDSAAVFFLLRSKGISLREKVKATLEVESGANDPMAIFLTIAFIMVYQQYQAGAGFDFWTLGIIFIKQLLVGLGGGFIMARVMEILINRFKLETALYPIFVLGLALLCFAVINMLGGSGFLAVYISGVLLGNRKIQAHAQIGKFQKTVTWLSQITLFVTLGLFVTLDGLKNAVLPAILMSAALMLVARPAMVWSILTLFKTYTPKEKNFISFVGLRGATAILLALTPIVYNLPFAHAFLNIIFVMVLISLGLQGFLIPWSAKVCAVAVPAYQQTPERTEIDLPGLSDSFLIMYELTDQSPVLKDVKIPRWAKPTLVIRNGVAYPAGSTIKRLQAGDKVYVFSPSANTAALLDRIFGADTESSESSVLFGDFPINPQTKFRDLAVLYGVAVHKSLEDMSIANFIAREFDDVEVGDRLALDTIDLVVRAREKNKVTAIGIDIDPSRRRLLKTRIWPVKKA